nr:alpha-amylase family glycosyl hydrolase [Clostridium thermobutyricum]
MDKVKDQGFDAIQISPIQPLKEEGQIPWYLLYQPINFSIGNQYGSREELIKLCNESKENNIKIIVDVVLNHVAGKDNGELIPSEKVDNDIKSNPDFFKDNRNIINYEDRREVIDLCIGLPCLRLDNYQLQDIIIKFLNDLIDCGVDGFRFDAAKHIKLPSEGSDFWIRVLNKLKRRDLFNYAEVIFSPKEILEEYSKYVNVLTESEALNEDISISFVESHDSYLEFCYTNKISSEDIIKKYKELCRRRKNTLFYARPFDNTWQREEIKIIHQKRE